MTLTCLQPLAESSEQAWSVASDHVPGEEIQVTPLGPAARTEAAKSPAHAGSKRVLLIEDDAAFREAIRDYFSEIGYTVREAHSGLEGIREILAGDFTVVLCDMMMPGLPGDLFYRAVNRARPKLCERFIFMTGHRADPATNDFLSEVKGNALLKPFGFASLLKAVGEVERRQQPASQREEAVAALERKARGQPSVSPIRALPDPIRPVIAARAPSAPRPAPAHAQPKRTRVTAELEDYRPIWQRISTAATMALAILGLLGTWYYRTQDQGMKAVAELRALEGRLAAVTEELGETRKVGRGFELITERTAQVTNDCQRRLCSSVLLKILACTSDRIQMQDIKVRRGGLGAAWTLRLTAQSAGDRLVADAFRGRVQQELQKIFPGVVTTRFEEIEDLPADAAGAQGHPAVNFTMVAALAQADKAAMP